MSYDACHLFCSEETGKPRGVGIGRLNLSWKTKGLLVPIDAPSSWKEISHQVPLIAQFDDHVSLSKLWEAAWSIAETTLPRLGSDFWRNQLYVAVHSLPSGTFHDDMNRDSILMWLDQVADVDVLADELLNLGHSESVGDLTSKRVSSRYQAETQVA